MKSRIIFLAGVGLVALAANGQRLQTDRDGEDYIKWPSSADFANYVKQWTPGQEIFPDENFFISRVKTKPVLKRNVATQIYETINDDNDKKLLFWVPMGNTNLNGVHTDALPNGLFDSEVFSTWSYVTHFGDWTSPHGWVPGGFADAAHRHGVAVTGVASIPNAALSGNWLSCLSAQGSLDVEKAGQFLLYHGVNGLGYNSEYGSASSVQPKLRDFHIALNKYMADKDPVFEIVAYDGTSDNGNIAFSERLCSTNQLNFGAKGSECSNLFINYNWNADRYISESQEYCQKLDRNMLDLYAGMNMQGGCKTATEWIRHQTVNYSIGLWGAHDFNYLWAPRSKNGSSDINKQRTYQTNLEWWFTNGKRNPAQQVEVYEEKSLAVTDKWFGMSRFMSARTTLGWDLASEPFISYFNLGNGRFFNYEGERQNDNGWYNIGVQDYMPTWRFWFADKFIGKTPQDVPVEGLDAEFTWDDAYFGGSSLKVFGSSASEYLHLFKTSFKLERNDVITVRYKLLSGKANLNLALSTENAETTVVREDRFKVFTTEQEADDSKWIEAKFTVSGPIATDFQVNPLAMIALHFTEAENLEVLLGEISIKRGSYATPAAPRIKRTKVLNYNYAGVDAKVVFEMPNNKPVEEVCYNSDVNTSIFKLWAQQEGEEPVLMGATTSWAGICFAIPMNAEGSKKLRLGVQAVAMDRASASEIAWSEYEAAGDYTTSEAITISKSTIKPGEEFEIAFVDPAHAAANWQVINRAGTVVAENNGTSIVLPEGVQELGSYDVKVGETLYPYYFLVSAWDKGALPEITRLTVNDLEPVGEEVIIEPASDVILGYEGRAADGESSRGIEIEERFVGAKCSDLGIENYKSFGAAAWVNMRYPSAASSLFQVENRAGAWPNNNWGWCWFGVSPEGVLSVRFRGSSQEMGYYYDNVVIPETWTHVAFSFEYMESKFRFRLFVNGIEQIPTLYGSAAGGGGVPTGSDMNRGEDGKYDLWINNRYPIASSDWLTWGGGRGSEPAYNNGTVDHMVVWDGPITEADAKAAMAGYDETKLPENVLAFWSFEGETDVRERTETVNGKDILFTDFGFFSKGQKTDAMVINFALENTGAEGQAMQSSVAPVFSAGCPTLEGAAYKVTTVPTWTAKRGVVSEAAGNDREGKATVTYAKEGDYNVTLKLENALGSHTMTYPVLVAKESHAINGVEAEEAVAVYTTESSVVVEFPEAGDYTVAVFNIEGKLAAKRSQNVEAGQAMNVKLNANGVYMVAIEKDGRTLRTVKLIKK